MANKKRGKSNSILLILVILILFVNTLIVTASNNLPIISENKTLNELFSSSLTKQPNAIIILNSSDKNSMQESREYIESLGGKIRHIYPPHILIGYVPEEVSQKITNEKTSNNSQKIKGLENIVSISNSEVDSSTLEKYGKTEVYAANAWNKNFMGIGPEEKPIPDPGPIKDYVGLPLDYEESKGSMIIHHSPPSDTETSSFMIRDISVAIIFLESNGSIDTETEDWTTTEENNVISEIQNGLNWWIFKEPYADIAFTYAHTSYSMSTSYEPITRPHTDDNLWVIEAMNYLGYDDGEYKLRVRAYDDDIRDSDGTDWGFTIFVVDSSNDGDGEFSDNDWFAYAWPNGPFAVVTYDNDGYGISHMDAVVAHETGHIFGAADQYDGADPNCNEDSDCSATFGYLEVENQNCERDACISKENSIMRGGTTPFTNNNIDIYAEGQVGWRDEDSDNIIDSADHTYNQDDDTDGDGWVDYWDKCPTQSGQAGLAWGCPDCTAWQQVGGCGDGGCEFDEKNYTRTCLGAGESKCEYTSSCESGGGVTDCTPNSCTGDYEQQGQVSCEWDGNYWTCERVCRKDAECGSSLSLIYDSGLQSQGINNQDSGSLSTSSTSASDTDYCYKIMSLNNRQYVSSWGWFDADSTYTPAGIYGPTQDTDDGCYNEISDGQNIYPGSANVCLAPDTPDSWGGLSGCTTYRAGSGYGSGYYSKISFLSYNDAGCGGGFDDINSQTLYTQFKVYETPFTPEDYDYLYCDVPYTSDIYLDSTIYGDSNANCDVEVQGSESNPDEIQVKWYVNGDYVYSETCGDGECDDHSGSPWSNTFSLPHSYYEKGDEVYCIGRGYGEDGGHGAYDSSSTTTVSNRAPTWSSISLDKSYAKQGDNIKVTASGQADLDSDILAMYCCNGDSCTPSTSNHDFCYVTGDSSPYDLYCTGQGVNGNGTKTVRCRIYDGDGYSTIQFDTYTINETAEDNPPIVELIGPLDNSIDTDGNVAFNCSATDDKSLVNITLYGNWSGGWHANETKGLSGTSDSVTFNKTLSNGIYEWNCLAYDNSSQFEWANSNYTLNITLTNSPPTTPTSLLCDGEPCIYNETFYDTIQINCSGSTDPEKDNITYFIDAYYNHTNSEENSINQLNNSLQTENLTFSGNQNVTRYLEIPKTANVVSATLNLTGSSVGSDGWCYQETANVSTACGGLATGAYTCTGNWDPIYPCSATYDGNWNNYGSANSEGGTSEVDINYTIPQNTSMTTLWQVRWDGPSNPIVNYSINNCIYGQKTLQIKVIIQKWPDSIDASCYNGTSWLTIFSTGSGGGGAALYEEAVIWNMTVSYPNYPWFEVGTSDGVYEWNFTGPFNQTNNKTNDFSSTLNSALNNGICNCTGCSLNGNNCLIPFIFHSDTVGILEYRDINVKYMQNGVYWSDIGNHSASSVLNWNISNITEQSGVDLRCKAIDLQGSNTYSDYYHPGINLTIGEIAPNDTTKFYIKNNLSENVAWLGDSGNIVLKGVCYNLTNLNLTGLNETTAGEDAFLVRNSTGSVMSFIDTDGNLVISKGNCENSVQGTCNPSVPAFIVQNSSDVNMSYIDNKGGLCLKGGLYENADNDLLDN